MDYTGELMIKLKHDAGSCSKSEFEFPIKAGDRIAQAMIIPFTRIQFSVVEEIKTTQRGTGGFGSTGA